MSTSETGAHEESVEERLGHVGARIDDLIVRLGHASEKFRSSVGDHLETARQRRQELRADLERLRDAKIKAWEDYRAKVETAEAEMDADVAIARAQLDADLAKTRDEFVSAVRSELDAWQHRIDQLKARAEHARMESHEQIAISLEGLRLRRDAAQSKLDEIVAASGDAWTALTEGTRRALDELKAAAEQASIQLV